MKHKAMRWIVNLAAAGTLYQAAGCNLDAATVGALSEQVVTRQIANLITDTAFFILDNALVRFTT